MLFGGLVLVFVVVIVVLNPYTTSTRKQKTAVVGIWPAGVISISRSALYLGKYRTEYQTGPEKNIAEYVFFPHISKKACS